MRNLVTGFLLQALVLNAAVTSAVQNLSAQTGSAVPVAASRADAEDGWRKQIETWRVQRERELTAADGWLTLVALDWLKSGLNSVGSAPDNTVRVANIPEHLGVLTVSGRTVQLLQPHTGFPADLKLNGGPPREGPLSADERRPSSISWHSITMVVLPRGDRYVLRVKDANAATRTGFHGLKWYPPDLHYTVEAKWIPFNPPRMIKIPTAIGTTLELPSPGTAEFMLDGKTLRLQPVLEDPHDTALFFVLRDTTSRMTTYPGGRFLRTAFPDHGLSKPGTLVIDFNQIYNPPCAYTPYATCPLPPEQNRLPIALEAGEERYTP